MEIYFHVNFEIEKFYKKDKYSIRIISIVLMCGAY